MNYLVYMLMLAFVMAIFLRIVMIFERGEWPSENVSTVGDAVRELLARRRPS